MTDIAHTQQKLESISWQYGESLPAKAYRIIVQFSGKHIDKSKIFTLFDEQQRNVRNLTYALADTIMRYEPQLKNIRDELEKSITLAEKTYADPQQLRKMLEAYRSNENNASLQVDAATNPQQYFSSLRGMLNAKRNRRSVARQVGEAAYASDHYMMQIEAQIMQEEIFDFILGRAKEMAVRTELYQRHLDVSLAAWRGINDIGGLVNAVSGGMQRLSTFNNDLHTYCMTAVRDISALVDNHPSSQAMGAHNSDLRSLVSSIDNRL